MEQRPIGERLNVLIADGEPDMRFYLRSCLRRLPLHPVRVLEASDDATGLRLMTDEPAIDLVLAQAEGRGSDGSGFARTLDAAGRATAAVVLVSDAAAVGRWESDRGQAPVRGATLLGKPFNATQLIEAVVAALSGERRGGPLPR